MARFTLIDLTELITNLHDLLKTLKEQAESVHPDNKEEFDRLLRQSEQQLKDAESKFEKAGIQKPD